MCKIRECVCWMGIMGERGWIKSRGVCGELEVRRGIVCGMWRDKSSIGC